MSRAPGQSIVLVIIDGWGYREEAAGNAIAAARKPNWERLWQQWPHTVLSAAGEAVGLPAGQQGNSEVGHLNIGAGRIVYQDLTRINLAIKDGTFHKNPILLAAMRSASPGNALHLVGLVSPGGVHSSSRHLYALLRMAKEVGVRDVFVHVLTDGRDEPPSSAADYVADLAQQIEQIGTGRIASISGRYFAMDRDKRWDRTERAYRVIVEGQGPAAKDAIAFIRQSYAAGKTDEFIEPTRIIDPSRGSAVPAIEDGDSVVFFNFRPDRARQLSHALADPEWPYFKRPRQVKPAHFVTFTEYEKGLKAEVAFTDQPLHECLAEVISKQGAAQFHTAETEKYAHVTYFFNGGKEAAFPGEERLLIPSQKVATYDLAPEMSAAPVAQALLDRVTGKDDRLVVVNFANPDMVGHTGVFPATVRAVEVVDGLLGKIVDATLSRGRLLAITADHGNAELKVDPQTGSPLTAHTTSPVPLIMVGAPPSTRLRDRGKLADVAPTLLRLAGIEVPGAMTGDDLGR